MWYLSCICTTFVCICHQSKCIIILFILRINTIFVLQLNMDKYDKCHIWITFTQHSSWIKSNFSPSESCPLAFNGIISTLRTLRKSFKENIDSLETVENESFTNAFQKTKKKTSKLTNRNLVATKSEKPMASQTKWHRDCDLDEKEIDWKKNISAYKNMH